jgi:hypothetical protein
VSNVQNTSISLEWKSPLQANGVLLNYNIYYNNTRNSIDKNFLQFKLPNLKSFTRYEISVEVCNARACSENNTIHVKTKIGFPGKVGEPHKNVENGKNFGWERPEESGGCVDYYEMKQDIEHKKKKTETSERIIIDNNYTPTINCQDGDIYKFYVRAVNVDYISDLEECKQYKDIRDIESLPSTIVKYYGEWSEPKLESCGDSQTEIWYSLRVCAIICGLVLIIVLIIITFNRMKNLKPKIPSGLIDITSEDITKKGNTAHEGKIAEDEQNMDEIEFPTKKKCVSVSSDDSGISTRQNSEVSHEDEINELEAIIKVCTNIKL